MAYGNEGGGLAGGLASGLQSGLSFGANLYNQQADRDLRREELAREAGFRNQELELRGQESRRANQASRLQLFQARKASLDEQKDRAQRLASAAAGKQNAVEERHWHDILADLEAQDHQLGNDALYQMVDGQYSQMKADASDLANQVVRPADLPDDRMSNVVMGMNGGVPAIDAINGDHHVSDANPQGVAPLVGHAEDLHYHAASGNYREAANSLFHLVQGNVSAHPEDHEAYYSGFNRGDSGMGPDHPDIAHQQIAKATDIAGRRITAIAAANADPDIAGAVIRAHQAGHTANQMAAQHVLADVGGPERLHQLAQPNALEQAYQQNYRANLADGYEPEQAHGRAIRQTVQQQTRFDEARQRQWYIDNGYRIPDDLKETDKEKTARVLYEGYMATGKYTQALARAKANREAYAPQIVEAEIRHAARTPLRSAPPQQYRDTPAAAAGLPPEAAVQLREKLVTRFGNGQWWTLRDGQPVRVK